MPSSAAIFRQTKLNTTPTPAVHILAPSTPGLLEAARSWWRDNKNVLLYHGRQSMINPNSNPNLDLNLWPTASISGELGSWPIHIETEIQKSVGSKERMETK